MKKRWSSEVIGVFSTVGVFAEKLPAVDGKMTVFFMRKNKILCLTKAKPCKSSIHKAPDE